MKDKTVRGPHTDSGPFNRHWWLTLAWLSITVVSGLIPLAERARALITQR